MNQHPCLELPPQPKMDRRGFLTFAAKGLAIAFALPVVGRSGLVGAAAPTPATLATAFIHIGGDGVITLQYGGSEMGQGTMSGLPQILAEELAVDWNQITIRQSPVDPTVTYFTGGSSAVSGRYATLRTAGAAAREMLIAAAMQLKGDAVRDNFSAKSAVVTHVPSGATWAYGTLASLAGTLTPPADLRLTDPAKFRLIGTRVPRVDIPAKTDGSAKFGIDVWLPNMVFAAIKHSPVFGGTVASLPTKLSGAIAVVPCKATETRGKVQAGSVNAVAVVASNTWLAMRLANSVAVKWTTPASTADVDSASIMAQATQLLASGAALVAEPAPPQGATPAGYAASIEPIVASALGTPTVAATYTLPYLAHATMEVLNCTVDIVYAGTQPQSCEIWAPTQAASLVASNAGQLTGLPANQITVHTTFLGGGLGRKFEQDYIVQAIQVAMAVKRPVKLTWRREEDFAHDQYRPLALVGVKAKLSAGRITAWSYRNVSQSILGQRGWLPPNVVDSQAVEGAVHLPYDLGTHLVEWVPLPAGIPVGFWRSVGASINAFVVESVMDELASAAGVDPFTFRYNHLGNSPRVQAVLWAADTVSAPWRKTLATGHAWGVAVAESFGTVVAQVVEISAPSTGAMRVHRVACVVDCGTVINPDSVESQMQGSIVHAMNAALWGQMTFSAGKAVQQNFNRYRMMRLGDMPQVTVQIMPSTNPPTGIGEPGVPPLAPALANAYARLTGVRVRTLPFFPNATMGGG
ncbi:MAG: molybdopterin cofactor-binding domain-containing protein [Casimicrobiaceae bacterium]